MAAASHGSQAGVASAQCPKAALVDPRCRGYVHMWPRPRYHENYPIHDHMHTHTRTHFSISIELPIVLRELVGHVMQLFPHCRNLFAPITTCLRCGRRPFKSTSLIEDGMIVDMNTLLHNSCQSKPGPPRRIRCRRVKGQSSKFIPWCAAKSRIGQTPSTLAWFRFSLCLAITSSHSTDSERVVFFKSVSFHHPRCGRWCVSAFLQSNAVFIGFLLLNIHVGFSVAIFTNTAICSLSHNGSR